MKPLLLETHVKFGKKIFGNCISEMMKNNGYIKEKTSDKLLQKMNQWTRRQMFIYMEDLANNLT